MFVRGLLALEERRRVRADRVVRPYEWQRFALRDVGDAVPYERDVGEGVPYGRDVEDAVPCGMGFRACGRGERIPTPVTSVTGSE